MEAAIWGELSETKRKCITFAVFIPVMWRREIRLALLLRQNSRPPVDIVLHLLIVEVNLFNRKVPNFKPVWAYENAVV